MRDREATAYDAAIRMLGRRDHFRSELGDKLRRKGYDRAEIEQALEKCAERGLINDEAIAARFVEAKATRRGWGRRRLESELIRRGVDRGLVRSAARQAPEESAAALATALRQAERRAPATWWRLHRARARMVSSLLSRGFATGDAVAAVNELAAERERQHAGDDEPGDPLSLP